MTIIDKNKDYYDYLQGVYGKDPKAVYLRQGSFVFDAGSRPAFLCKELPEDVYAWQGKILLTCGEIEQHIYFENTGNILFEEYHTMRVERPEGAAPLRIAWGFNTYVRNAHKSAFAYWKNMPSKEEVVRDSLECLTGVKTLERPNWLRNSGERDIWDFRIRRYGKAIDNPILATFPITIVPAEKVFIEIQDFILSRFDKDRDDNRTDDEKLEAAGFDKKTSFRRT